MRTYKLRPSAAATWVLCSGMPHLTYGIPDTDIDPIVREEGTACHWAASLPVLPAVGTVAPNNVEIDDEMLDACIIYHATIREWGPHLRVFFETPVHCYGIHDECGGTPDVFAFDSITRTLYLGDLKYGFRFVNVVNNWQLLCYLDGCINYLYLHGENINIVFMICQPRSYSKEGPVRQIRTTLFEVQSQLATLRSAAAIVMGSNPMCKVNAHCRQCSGRVRCAAARESALIEIENSHEATPHDLPFAAAEDELRRLHWAADIVAARITGLEQQVMHAMRKDGKPSRYFDLKQSYGRQVWREGAAPVVQAMAHYLGENVNKENQLITPTQAKKKIPAALVDMHSHRTPGALKLVPSDPEIWRRIFGNKP